MMKISFAILVLLALSNQALADVVPMVCSGLMHVYGREPIEANVPSGAASVDIPNKQVVTPIGSFPIFRVEDNAIAFGIPSIAGRLDRLTGKMEIYARPDGDKTDMRSSMPAKLMTFTELNCSVAKRMF
jgi:hypothetical protein